MTNLPPINLDNFICAACGAGLDNHKPTPTPVVCESDTGLIFLHQACVSSATVSPQMLSVMKTLPFEVWN